MNKWKIAGLAAAMLIASAAEASQITNGYVADVLGMKTGAVMFTLGTNRTDAPACASAEPARWAIEGTSVGQQKLAIILTAKALNRSVQVYGTGTCSIWADTETVDYIIMN